MPTAQAQGSPEPDDALFATIHAGFQALGQLLQQHQGYLWRIAHEELGQELAPRVSESDVISDTLLNIIKNLNNTTNGIFAALRDKDNLRRWVRAVCLNALNQARRREGEARRDLRRETPTVPEDVAAGGPSPSSMCRRDEESERLSAAVNGLSEADRLLFRLHMDERYKLSERHLAALLDGYESDAGRGRVQRRLKSILVTLGTDETIRGLLD